MATRVQNVQNGPENDYFRLFPLFGITDARVYACKSDRPKSEVRSPRKAEGTAPLAYNTQSGLSPRELPFRSIDLGEVAFRPYPT